MTKSEAMEEMARLGVPARPFFYPLSSLPAFPGLRERYEPQNPVAYDLSARGINLPGALNLVEAQVDKVCGAIKQMLGIHG